MSDNRFSRPVAFNKTKPTDVALLKHIGQRNFSGYVKKLIFEDMRNNARNETIVSETPAQPLTAAERLAQLKRTSQVARPK